MSEASPSYYGPCVYRVGAIPSTPSPRKKRERIGEELLPYHADQYPGRFIYRLTLHPKSGRRDLMGWWMAK